ncbi:MAG: hypothetical protein ACXWVH_01500 [Caulobacteraceae bacterium]
MSRDSGVEDYIEQMLAQLSELAASNGQSDLAARIRAVAVTGVDGVVALKPSRRDHLDGNRPNPPG